MPKILVVFDSKTGNTEKMAHLVAEGAREVEDVEVVVKRVDYVTPAELTEYQGLIIGSPVYGGMMTAKIKNFFDSRQFFHGGSYKLTEGKIGGVFVTTLSDGMETAMISIMISMIFAKMVVTGPGPEYKWGRIGAFSLGKPVKEQDVELCKALGRRVAKLAKTLFD